MNKLLGKLILCGAALAMGNAYSHGTPIPNHGGVIQAVGETWLELVVKGDKIELYLEDDGDPMESAGVTGTVSVSGKPDEFALAPAGENKLVAKGKVPAGAKVITQLLLADKKTKVATTFALK
jgi:hypothetical protein